GDLDTDRADTDMLIRQILQTDYGRRQSRSRHRHAGFQFRRGKFRPSQSWLGARRFQRRWRRGHDGLQHPGEQFRRIARQPRQFGCARTEFIRAGDLGRISSGEIATTSISFAARIFGLEKSIKAVLWDVGGTLAVLKSPSAIDSITRTLARCNIDPQLVPEE